MNEKFKVVAYRNKDGENHEVVIATGLRSADQCEKAIERAELQHTNLHGFKVVHDAHKASLCADDELDYFGRHPARVMLCDRDMADETTVEILDIEEDMDGADVVTFVCPVCGEQHKSRRYG
jgi:predicted RNA-binding Zn-ribbon protein involved in translation (DUF1610 family)